MSEKVLLSPRGWQYNYCTRIYIPLAAFTVRSESRISLIILLMQCSQLWYVYMAAAIVTWCRLVDNSCAGRAFRTGKSCDYAPMTGEFYFSIMQEWLYFRCRRAGAYLLGNLSRNVGYDLLYVCFVLLLCLMRRLSSARIFFRIIPLILELKYVQKVGNCCKRCIFLSAYDYGKYLIRESRPFGEFFFDRVVIIFIIPKPISPGGLWISMESFARKYFLAARKT